MRMKHWWNDPDEDKPEILGIKLLLEPHCYHKSNADWPGIKSGPLRWEASK
jgi:hypothetical protein